MSSDWCESLTDGLSRREVDLDELLRRALDPITRELRADRATNRNLEQAVRDGEFREDLYYRLHVVELDVPPLRDRGHGDVDRLVDHFLAEFGRRHERPGLQLASRARNALHAHDWPGNVRELENCIEAAVVLVPGDVIEPDHVRIRPPLFHDRDHDLPDNAFVTGVRPLREVELDYILHVLDVHDGNRSAASRCGRRRRCRDRRGRRCGW